MNESTSDLYIAAFDAAWDAFVGEWYRRGKKIPPSKWEAFAEGFAAGVEFGRTTEAPQIGERR